MLADVCADDMMMLHRVHRAHEVECECETHIDRSVVLPSQRPVTGVSQRARTLDRERSQRCICTVIDVRTLTAQPPSDRPESSGRPCQWSQWLVDFASVV